MTKTEIECENKRIDGLKKKLKKYKEYIELLLKINIVILAKKIQIKFL
ncbi:hypothetical protein [Acidiplasma cupricumulans]|nr:hypothetical protein [Acidiplasma cupricumulans]